MPTGLTTPDIPRMSSTPTQNLTEISQGLDLLWRNNIPSKKVILGLGFYGRSFTLANSSCKEPGCPFSAGAKPGDCTKTSGVLSNSEIQRIIKDKDIEPILDAKAGVKYMSWDSDQWVSYDDADTFKMKMDFANELGLGGTSKWQAEQSYQPELISAAQWYGPFTWTTKMRNLRSIFSLAGL